MIVVANKWCGNRDVAEIAITSFCVFVFVRVCAFDEISFDIFCMK